MTIRSLRVNIRLKGNLTMDGTRYLCALLDMSSQIFEVGIAETESCCKVLEDKVPLIFKRLRRPEVYPADSEMGFRKYFICRRKMKGEGLLKGKKNINRLLEYHISYYHTVDQSLLPLSKMRYQSED